MDILHIDGYAAWKTSYSELGMLGYLKQARVYGGLSVFWDWRYVRAFLKSKHSPKKWLKKDHPIFQILHTPSSQHIVMGKPRKHALTGAGTLAGTVAEAGAGETTDKRAFIKVHVVSTFGTLALVSQMASTQNLTPLEREKSIKFLRLAITKAVMDVVPTSGIELSLPGPSGECVVLLTDSGHIVGPTDFITLQMHKQWAVNLNDSTLGLQSMATHPFIQDVFCLLAHRIKYRSWYTLHAGLFKTLLTIVATLMEYSFAKVYDDPSRDIGLPVLKGKCRSLRLPELSKKLALARRRAASKKSCDLERGMRCCHKEGS